VTKCEQEQGEDIYWAKQHNDADPHLALQNHQAVNKPDKNAHLFEYKHKGSRRPLTKTAFSKRLGEVAKAANIKLPQNHAFWIGGTLMYLLQGVPFDAMIAKGRWSSNTFLLYLREHAEIMAPYMQDSPDLLRNFARVAVPPIR
jgi:hypothetical protein